MLSKGCQDSEVSEKKPQRSFKQELKTWGAGWVFVNQGNWESSGDSGVGNHFEEGFRISPQEKA